MKLDNSFGKLENIRSIFVLFIMYQCCSLNVYVLLDLYVEIIIPENDGIMKWTFWKMIRS